MGVHTQRIEACWRPFRKFLLNRFARDDESFILAVAEYTWRRRCQLDNVDAFNDLIRGIKLLYPGNPFVDDVVLDDDDVFA